MPGRRLLSLLRVSVIAAMAILLLVCAYAAEQTPNLFDSLGKFFQPQSETPAAEASPPAEPSTPARNLAQQGAPGSRRIALVIGNDAYEKASKLEKAGNDATAIARELKTAGFDVLQHHNLNHRGMVKAEETLVDRITGSDQVVVFSAGHGVQTSLSALGCSAVGWGELANPNGQAILYHFAMRYRRAKVAGGMYFVTVNLADRQSSVLIELIDA